MLQRDPFPGVFLSDEHYVNLRCSLVPHRSMKRIVILSPPYLAEIGQFGRHTGYRGLRPGGNLYSSAGRPNPLLALGWRCLESPERGDHSLALRRLCMIVFRVPVRDMGWCIAVFCVFMLSLSLPYLLSGCNIKCYCFAQLTRTSSCTTFTVYSYIIELSSIGYVAFLSFDTNFTSPWSVLLIYMVTLYSVVVYDASLRLRH